ncbi:MAG: ABC transporter permease subunit [Bacteroidales bacterium]|nr:ABC transporter permease subunit [Bacteroidales bacterium]
MSKIWTIANRELHTFFDSLIAYIMIIAFLGFSGFFTWLYGADIFFVKQASLQSFFNIAYWTLFFFIPALTMRLFAEENRSGTLELLLTKPVSDWEVVLGKFLSTFFLILIALALTLPYYITVASIGPVDHGAVWSGYLGLILMSAAYISIGIYTSSISSNQIVGYLLALFIGIFFQIIFVMLAGNFTGLIGETLNYLSISTHFDSVSRGVIDTKDLIYFLTIIFLGMLLTEANLARKRL